MNKVLVNKAGNIILELRQETMSAWLTIKDTGKLIDENEILSLLDEAGIKTGFNEALAYIRDHSLEKEYGVPFPIAICNRAESTTTLRYRFNPDLQLDEENGLSFQILETLSFVEAGEVIAEYSNNLFEQGGSIYDIFGELIDPGNVDQEKALSLSGNNVQYYPTEHEYRSKKPGYPFLDDAGRICVLDLVVLQANNLPTGRTLHLQADTVIEGNLAYADLICQGSLLVKGDLHSCTMLCRKDLNVEGEIISCQVSGIHVQGELNCRGITDSKVLCKGPLRFSGLIKNSNIACGAEIIGDPNNSQISGGITQATSIISITTAGSLEKQKTEIEIAIMPYQRSLLMQMTREMVRLKEDPEANAMAITELNFKIQKCETELDELLNEFLHRPSEDRKSIKVSGDSHPPVLYRVLKHSYYLEKPDQNLEFIEKND